MIGFDNLFEEPESRPGVSGEWFCAQWSPDMGTGERLNIGVGFVTEDGGLELKLLEDFSRLACLFDDRGAAFHAELACRMVEEVVRSDRTCRGQVFNNLYLEDRGFAQGSDIDSIVNRLFAESVTLARPKPTQQKKPFQPISRDYAYNRISQRLKSRLGMNYEKYVPGDPFKRISDDFGTETLYLPFQRREGAATLVSAAYADPYRAKFQLYDGFRSVETAIKKDVAKDAALFLVLPGEGLDKKLQESLDDEIEKFYAFVNRHDIAMESAQDVDQLGENVANWCLAG